MRKLSLLLLVGLVGCAGSERMKEAPIAARTLTQPPEPTAAEYAVRWKVKAGGPQTGQEVLDDLGLDSADDKERIVRYFTVPRPADAPEDFDVILRQRINEKKNTKELTFKYRGKHPIAPPRCPLPKFDAEKSEVDVSFVSDYIEVSFSGSNDPADTGLFQTVVETLIGKGITPLVDGMTTLTIACRERKK